VSQVRAARAEVDPPRTPAARAPVDDWGRRWPDRVVEFPTNSTKRMAPAIDRFRTTLGEGRITHDGDPDLARHMLNVRLRKVGRTDDGRGADTLEKAGRGV
jgi:phage terminase large subunit-like protein